MRKLWRVEDCEKETVNETKDMDINEFNESLEGLIKQAESLNAGETSIAWDYNNEWQVKIVVKRKRKKVNKK